METKIISDITIINHLDNIDWVELEELFKAVNWDGFPKES